MLARAIKTSFRILALLFVIPTVHAEEDFSVWVSNTYQTDFGGSNFLAFLELAPRTRDYSGAFSQLLIRPILGYKASKEISLSLGYTWHGEYSKNLDDKFANATNDFIQQLQWIHDFSPALNFQYRLRLEQRFFADADIGHRIRQRFRVTYTIPGTQAYFIGADEIFIYLNNLNASLRESQVQQGINQNRSYAGFGYKITPDINVDTGYQLQYVNNFGRADLFNHIWLTNINVKF